MDPLGLSFTEIHRLQGEKLEVINGWELQATQYKSNYVTAWDVSREVSSL